jgi:hypothetical protein
MSTASNQTSLHLYQRNIDFLQRQAPELWQSLSIGSNPGEVSIAKSTNTEVPDAICLRSSGGQLIEDVFAEVSATMNEQIQRPKRLILSRVTSSSEITPLEALTLSVDSNISYLLDSLPCLNEKLYSVDPGNSFLARDVVMIGCLCLLGAASICETGIPANIIVIENDISSLEAFLHLCDFERQLFELKEHGVSLTIIFDQDHLNLIERFKLLIAGPLFLTGYGYRVYQSPSKDSRLEYVYSWLLAPEGFREYFRGLLGSETDEINQSIHAIYNASAFHQRKLLGDIALNTEKPLLIAGSGPSIDGYLDQIRHCEDSFVILTAGSALGTMLRNGIHVDAAVLLEMSSSVYDDMCDLIAEGFDLSDIDLIGSVTIDPRIPPLFASYTCFHRPFSASSCFFDSETESFLPTSGPQAINAALETAAKLNPSSIVLVGCDLSSTSPNKQRSVAACGVSPRVLDIPVYGNKGRTVYTDSELLFTRDSLELCLSSLSCSIYRLGEGLPFNSIAIDEIDDLSDLPDISLLTLSAPESTAKLRGLSCYLKETDNPNRDSRDNIPTIARKAMACISHILSYEVIPAISLRQWTPELVRNVSVSISLLGLANPPELRLASRLLRFPIFFLFQSIHDEAGPSLDFRAVDQSLSHIHDYMLLFLEAIAIMAEHPKPVSYDPILVRKILRNVKIRPAVLPLVADTSQP